MERFEVLKGLGSGTFGTVRMVKEFATGKLQAIKIISRGNVTKYLEGEIINHSILRHPHIVQFKEVFLTDSEVCIVMEYCNGSSLFNLVRTERRLKESRCRWFFQQLILAVDYTHKRGVVNRDIKLENLLLHNEENLPHPLLKMCDFGYSKNDGKSAAKSQVGTLSYMAPEVMKSSNNQYNAKLADVWSCGVVLYVLLYGTYPFDGSGNDSKNEANKVRMMLERMEKQTYTIYDEVEVSDSCLDLLRRLLHPIPEQRITMDEILDHPWFNKKLPPSAKSMSGHYLTLPFPSNYQKPEAIRDVLTRAREKKMTTGF